MGNRIMQVVSRCKMSGKAVIRRPTLCDAGKISVVGIPRLGSGSASIVSEGDARQKTGER